MNWLKERFIPLFILGFLALSLWPIGYVQHQQQQNSNPANNASEQGIGGAVSEPLVVVQLEQTPASHQRQKPQDWQTRDHKAQIGMFWVAVFATGLTFLGLVLVGFTLHFTRRAAQAARETLNVAKDTLDIGRQNARIEMQPYVSIEAVDIKNFEPKFVIDKIHFGFLLTLNIKNVGKTPIENMFINIGSRAGAPMSRGAINEGPFSSQTIKKTKHMSTMGAASLGADDVYERKFDVRFFLTDEDIEGFDSDPLEQNKLFCFAVRVSFRDKFTSRSKHEGMPYERRVYISDYWYFSKAESLRPAISSLEVPAKKVDYPEEHNKSDNFWPHLNYGSGALSEIKLRDATAENMP